MWSQTFVQSPSVQAEQVKARCSCLPSPIPPEWQFHCHPHRSLSSCLWAPVQFQKHLLLIFSCNSCVVNFFSSSKLFLLVKNLKLSHVEFLWKSKLFHHRIKIIIIYKLNSEKDIKQRLVLVWVQSRPSPGSQQLASSGWWYDPPPDGETTGLRSERISILINVQNTVN